MSFQIKREGPSFRLRTLASLILLSIFPLAGCHKGGTGVPQSGPPPVTLEVTPPIASGMTREISVAGVVRGIHEADLTARVDGQVERILVHLGERVGKGQPLVVLSGQTYASRLSRAEAALSYARTSFARIDRLYQTGSASRSEWDRAKQALDVASAQEREAKARLSWTRVVAPFAGRIANRAVHRGDVVRPGAPLLSVIDSSRLEVVAHVPDSLVGNLKIGLPVTFKVEETLMTGRIRDLSPRSDPLTHTVTVKVLLSPLSRTAGGKAGAHGRGGLGADHLVGIYGKLYIPVSGTPGLFVPASAVIDHEGLHEIFVVENGHAVLRYVRTGRREDGRVEILSGLSRNEKIVSAPPPTLEDGAAVVERGQ